MVQQNIKSGKKGEKKHEQFHKILSAAAKIFRIKGYHHATVQEIADDIGMQKGSLYYYIKSKEELLYEIINSATDMFLENMFEIVNLKESADVVFRKAILMHMNAIEVDNDKIYVFLNEYQSLSEDYSRNAEIKIYQYESLLKSIMDRGKKTGVFKPDLDTKIALLGIIGMCNWTVRWFQLNKKYNIKEIAEIYINSFLDGIKTKQVCKDCY